MLLQVAIITVALFGPALYSWLRYKRFKQYAYFPQMPSSLLWGHMKIVDEFIKAGKPMGHPELAFGAINEALGNPPLMFLDLRPLSKPLLVVTNHDVAEQVTRITKRFPYGVPKNSPGYDQLVHVIGQNSLISVNDEKWRLLRKRFNPGFAPQYLLTFLPCILEKSQAFLDYMDDFAKSDQTFPLVRFTGNLTFDIITDVVMGTDFEAQKLGQQDPFITTYQELFETYTKDSMDLPWYLTPSATWKRHKLSSQIRKTLQSIVHKAFANRLNETTKSRSVLALSLPTDTDTLSTSNVDEICDQLSTFLLAGHDTTSIMLAWAFYELSRLPSSLKALRKELDELFGPDSSPSAVRNKLLAPGGQDLLSRMPYTSAVIKETLRLWPPAGTARSLLPGTGLEVETSSGKYSLAGVSIFNCVTSIQRDPEIYGDTANDFVPERWLHGAAEAIPASAWRPFERGPRNCIGQELANIEARVVIALVARRYDFSKVGIGASILDESGRPILDANGRFKVDSEMYTTRQMTAKPVDGMMMRVKMRNPNAKPE